MNSSFHQNIRFHTIFKIILSYSVSVVVAILNIFACCWFLFRKFRFASNCVCVGLMPQFLWSYVLVPLALRYSQYRWRWLYGFIRREGQEEGQGEGLSASRFFSLLSTLNLLRQASSWGQGTSAEQFYRQLVEPFCHRIREWCLRCMHRFLGLRSCRPILKLVQSLSFKQLRLVSSLPNKQ